MKFFAVAGNPVSHSLSPRIWNYSFNKLGIDAHYFRISAETAYDVVKMIKGLDLSGCNITSPFKEDILQYIDKTEGDAAKIKAVNCIVPIGKKLVGYNTDVDGFYSALVLNGFNPQDKKAVVIGSGGAAKAVLHSLIKNGASDLVVVNRTYDKAKKLAQDFGCRTCGIDKIEQETKDANLLVSCAATLERLIKKDAIHKKLTVFDANYSGDSVLKKDAEFAGCRIIDGKEWLIYQGAFFFKDLFNELPVEHMKESLKAGQKHGAGALHKNSITLIGFMGTGKTILGKALAEKLKHAFVDVDALIEKKEGAKIEEIFGKKGEEYFRKVETQVLKSIDMKTPSVISCGGGAVISSENVEFMKANSKVLWIWSDLEDIRKRITGKGRPLFKDAENLFKKRNPMYAKACDICFMNTSEKGTLKQILREVGN